jgi:hypothetical protein
VNERRQDGLWLTIAVGATTLAVVLVTKLWRFHPTVPIAGAGGDTNLSLMSAKTMAEKGWFLHTGRLGAPLGQQLYDYPSPGDTLHFVELKVLTLVSHNAAVIVNAFFLLSFVLVTVTAFIALRWLRVSRPASAAMSVLFACLPYHFLRAEPHLFLSNYYVVPLAGLLVLSQLGERPLLDLSWPGSVAELRRRLSRRSTLVALGICVLVGTNGLYYAVFACVLLAVAGLARAVAERRWWPLIAGAAMSAVILACVAASVIPTLLYLSHHGGNSHVVTRSYSDVEFYGLKIVNLLLPVQGHRIGALASFRSTAGSTLIPGEGTEALGFVGAIGLLAILGVAAGRLTGSSSTTERDQRLPRLALCVLAAILVGTVAGISGVAATLGVTQIRAWNRISVYIAFFCLAAVGLLIDRVAERIQPQSRRLAVAAVSMVLVIVGVWDQTTTKMVPAYAAEAASWNADATFFHSLEVQFGRGAVFELPFDPFPESAGVYKMADYEELRGYIHTKTLRWSYAAMKGRPASTWQSAVAFEAGPDLVWDVAAVGFDAIYVDRRGYIDNAEALIQELDGIVGAPNYRSVDDSLFVWDIRSTRSKLEADLGADGVKSLRNRILGTLPVDFGRGFYGEENDGVELWRWSREDAQITLTNDDSGSKSVHLRFGIQAVAPSQLHVSGPGVDVDVPVTTAPTPVDIPIVLRHGTTTLRLASDAPRVASGDSRDLRFRVVDAFARP